MLDSETVELLGNLGEFIGSIAVVVTLIYLAVQVRHSRELLEINKNIALGQISQTNAGYRLGLQRYLSEQRVLELREKVEGGDAIYSQQHIENFAQLTPQEKMLWRSVQAQFAIIIDDGLYQSSLGLVGERDTATFTNSALQSRHYWESFGNYVPTRLTGWYEDYDNR